MPLLDLDKTTTGLSRTWSGFLRDWDRSLRSGSYPETTRHDEETTKVLGTCKGRDFVQLRDEAIIRLYCNTGAWLSEVGNLALDDIDLTTESVHCLGKGSKDRRVRFGPKTARAVSRYLRARAKHKAADLPDMWLAERRCGAGDHANRNRGLGCERLRVWRDAGVDTVRFYPVGGTLDARLTMLGRAIELVRGIEDEVTR
nr:tyrosine-type recombinase/integrase [Streptomyces albicerus]